MIATGGTPTAGHALSPATRARRWALDRLGPLGHHSTIGDHVMVTSQVVISGGCTVEPHCFFGVNATIRDETVIGRETLVGAGVTILADTEPYSVYKAAKAEPAGFRSDQIRSISHKSGG